MHSGLTGITLLLFSIVRAGIAYNMVCAANLCKLWRNAWLICSSNDLNSSVLQMPLPAKQPTGVAPGGNGCSSLLSEQCEPHWEPFPTLWHSWCYQLHFSDISNPIQVFLSPWYCHKGWAMECFHLETDEWVSTEWGSNGLSLHFNNWLRYSIFYFIFFLTISVWNIFFFFW